jgi:hypothetical protein
MITASSLAVSACFSTAAAASFVVKSFSASLAASFAIALSARFETHQFRLQRPLAASAAVSFLRAFAPELTQRQRAC